MKTLLPGRIRAEPVKGIVGELPGARGNKVFQVVTPARQGVAGYFAGRIDIPANIADTFWVHSCGFGAIVRIMYCAALSDSQPPLHEH